MGFGRCLVTACLNINSLLAYIDELRAFVSQSNDIDILAIIKTKLDSDYSWQWSVFARFRHSPETPA